MVDLERLTAENDDIIISNGNHGYVIMTCYDDGLHICEQYSNGFHPEKEKVFPDFHSMVASYYIDKVPLRDVLHEFKLITCS